MKLQIRVSSVEATDIEDDGLGQQLVKMLGRAVERGAAPPVAVVLRGTRIDVIELAPVVQARVNVPWFLAGLTRSDVEGEDGWPDAVGLMGVFELRRDGELTGVELPLVFLEWSDNHWWHWKALLEPTSRQLRPDTVTVASARDGDAMPPRLGRWWSLGRRAGLGVRLGRVVH